MLLRAVSSRICLVRMFIVRKMILSTVSLSTIYPLDSLRTLKNLSDDGTVAGIGQRWKAIVDDEVVEKCEYRVTVPFGRLNFTMKRLRTNSHRSSRYLFWSWPGDTADGNRLPGHFHGAPPVDLRKAEGLTGYDTIKCRIVAYRSI